MDGLAGTDTSQVAVALIGEDESVGPYALDAGGHCGSPAMGSLLPVDIDITVGEDAASYR